jgi:hypothetical protein
MQERRRRFRGNNKNGATEHDAKKAALRLRPAVAPSFQSTNITKNLNVAAVRHNRVAKTAPHPPHNRKAATNVRP